MIRSYTAVVLSLSLSLAATAAARAQQPAAAPAAPAAPGPFVMSPEDTTLWSEIGIKARTRTTQLQASRAADNARVIQGYRDALGQMDRGHYDSAGLTLQAVLVRANTNPLYHGELAYALARYGDFEASGNSYARAYQMLQANAWYIVGVAATHAAAHSWADAAGAIGLAARSDSAIVTGPVATAAAAWFERAGDRTTALEWARLGAARDSTQPGNWLRIASLLRVRQDTTPEGLAAIRRYRAMKPDDRLGAALYSDYLYQAGKFDSAITLATYAAQDSSYREFAAQLYLQAGRDFIQRQPRNVDSAMIMLNAARPWANATQRPVFANLLGRAQLLKANTALQQFNDNQLCAPARLADSLLTEVERNLREGMSFDSTRTSNILIAVPGAKQSAQNAVHACRETAPAAPPAPAHRPARPPAPPPARRP